jgi:hypothetical protein
MKTSNNLNILSVQCLLWKLYEDETEDHLPLSFNSDFCLEKHIRKVVLLLSNTCIQVKSSLSLFQPSFFVFAHMCYRLYMKQIRFYPSELQRCCSKVLACCFCKCCISYCCQIVCFLLFYT